MKQTFMGIVGVLVFAWSAFACGHSSNTAFFHLKANGQQPLLYFSTATAAFEPILKDRLQVADLKTVNATIVKGEILKYLQETTIITCNGSLLQLSGGGVKLSNHQTQLIFAVGVLPKDIKAISLDISGFSSQPGQVNLFRYTNISGEKQRVRLSEENAFEAQLNLVKPSAS